MKRKKDLIKEIELLKVENARLTKLNSYDKSKIADDFNIFTNILEQKTLIYENIVFNINRYINEKHVDIQDEEVNNTSAKIVSETIMALSEDYVEYLVKKYFSSLDAMIDIYIQSTYLRLFAKSSEYNNRSTIEKNNK